MQTNAVQEKHVSTLKRITASTYLCAETATFRLLIITSLMYLIFFGRKTSQKYYEGRYVCNRGPEGANYEVICPRAVTCNKNLYLL